MSAGGLAFGFHGLALVARASGALWWPGPDWLIVADLHLGKSARMARRGGALLPPYEGRLTLERLGAEIAVLAPRRVVSLGDGFDDLLAAEEAAPELVADLLDLARGRDWLWIAGNHDAGAMPAHLPGESCEELALPLMPGQARPTLLRHEATPGQGPDISGHFHPVLRLGGERRRCFLIGERHLILPAFGAYTGGLACEDAAFDGLIGTGRAAVCVGARVLPVPMRQGGRG